MEPELPKKEMIPTDAVGEKQELFPTTRWTLLSRTLDGDSRDEALAELCQLYWSPVYFFIRKRGSNPVDSEDLTQGFFAQMLKRKQFQRAAETPDAGRLRSYLLKSVQNFLISQHEREFAQKRGGGVERISIDAEGTERQFVICMSDEMSPEEMFDRRWAANVLERTFTRLEKEYDDAGKGNEYSVLKATLGQTAQQVPFAEMGEKLKIGEGAARIAAFRLRKQFRSLIRSEIRETTTSSEEYEDELNHLKHLLGG